MSNQPVGDGSIVGITSLELDHLQLQPGTNGLAFQADRSQGYHVPALASGARNVTRQLTIALFRVTLRLA